MRSSKLQNPNHKQIRMEKIPNSKQYDLEERTAVFAERCRDFVKGLPKTAVHVEYGKQLIRSLLPKPQTTLRPMKP